MRTDGGALHGITMSRRSWLVMGALFVAALGIRLYGINTSQFDFHPIRQYRAMLIAQSYYYDNLTAVPEWKRRVSSISAEREGRLEPPILERAAAFGFQLTGGQRLWIPRLISIGCWLIGGIFLYQIAIRIGNPDSALFATAFHLFLPFGVLASRSFQPDPLMIMLQLLSIYLMLRYFDQPTWSRLASTASAAAAAILVKPVALFVVFFVFVALSLLHHRRMRTVVTTSILFAIGAVLPAALYYLPGLMGTAALANQAESSFQPSLLLTTSYWQQWPRQVRVVVGFTPFVGALLGLTMIVTAQTRMFLMGLWGGYVMFCLVFTYHIHTHDYYHLQLVPIVALSLGPIAALIAGRLRHIEGGRCWRMAPLLILGLGIFFAMSTAMRISRERASDGQALRNAELTVAAEIGDRINHSTDTLILASHYGKIVAYHGDVAVMPWPYRYDIRGQERLLGRRVTAEEILGDLSPHCDPRYFVVTDLVELQAQTELRDLLTARYEKVVDNVGYVIFRSPRAADDGSSCRLAG